MQDARISRNELPYRAARAVLGKARGSDECAGKVAQELVHGDEYARVVVVEAKTRCLQRKRPR
jgi:hypothetical protein